ncbi:MULTISPECIES: Hsp70 family protein [unclassified Synechocystis]|uniref:Hsp70 family protein n=1 Tax=unclassified Synechocystis TaxID=2640012 RepID=UPI00048BDBBB|nr:MULTISPECIES: Hsp70 family protein [unclassified Synechocystis]AIE75090.2 Chaperone protein DnaK [Synechocystis sp. PCC 6714]MCT0253212.1 Hsp70 family protein [Synechocystis sp. CS-94]
MSYAIDFGTTNTVIARWNEATRQGELIDLTSLSRPLGDSGPLIPSLIYVENAALGQVAIARQVLDRGRDIPTDVRFFKNFKRGIGAVVQGFLPQLDGQTLTFEKLGQWYLEKIVQTLTEQEGKEPDCLALTVPVDSFESYRHWLSETCHSWGIEEIRLLDEPTAAALGYGVEDASQILVLDFGGGTVDFSWVQLGDGGEKSRSGFLLKWSGIITGSQAGEKSALAKVVAKAGANLGGSDIDYWISEYFTEAQGLQVSPWIKRLAERLKIALGETEEATEVYFDDQAFESYEFQLRRSDLTEILQQRQFFARLTALWEQVQRTAQRRGLTPNHLDAVLVVGGTSRLPMVQDWINAQFPASKIRNQHPFGAIALGALQIYQGRQVQDYLYHSYGVRYWNRRKNSHNWHPIIKSGQGYPMAEPIELTLGASLNNQPSIELIVGELGSSIGATEVYFDGNQLITRVLENQEFTVQPLNDRNGARQIAQLSPPGVPGGDRVKVKFWVDDQRYLRLTVEDLLQQKLLLENQAVAQLR